MVRTLYNECQVRGAHTPNLYLSTAIAASIVVMQLHNLRVVCVQKTLEGIQHEFGKVVCIQPVTGKEIHLILELRF